MLKIYISYRAVDTSRDEVKKLESLLSANYGAANISISDTGVVDIFEVQKRVQAHDVLLLLIGQRFTSLMGEDGKPPITSVYDYLHAEIASALDSSTMRIFVVLTDEATMPAKAYFPEPLQRIMNREVIKLYNSKTGQNDYSKLRFIIQDKNRGFPRQPGVWRKSDYVPEPEVDRSGDKFFDVTKNWSPKYKLLDGCFWFVLFGVAFSGFLSCMIFRYYMML